MRLLRLPRRLSYATAFASFIAAVLLPLSVVAQPDYATPMYFTTLAGSGTEGSADGTGTAASFRLPNAVAVDSSGNIWVADSNNFQLRRITPAGVVSAVNANIPTPA